MRSDALILTNYPVMIDQSLNIPIEFSHRCVSKKQTLSTSVKAFRETNDIGISVNWRFDNAIQRLDIAIHTKSGTGIAQYEIPEGAYTGKVQLTEITRREISSFFQGKHISHEIDKYRKFDAHSDPILTDLVYGASSMITNIDDRKLVSKDFLLFCKKFSKKEYDLVKGALKYNPILEFSAINKMGIEMDFISLRDAIVEYSPYGYFLTKTPCLSEKIEVLRNRFSGIITLYLSDSLLKEYIKKSEWFRFKNVYTYQL